MAASVPPEGGAGGGTPASTPATQSTGRTKDDDRDGLDGDEFDVEQVVDGLIEKRGGGPAAARAALRAAVWDKKKLVGKVRALRARVVGDGDVILKGEQLTEYTALKALGLKPDEIKAKLAEHDTLQKEVKQTKHRQFLGDVADAIGIKNKPAWIKIAERSGIEIEMRDVMVEQTDGTKKATPMPYARLAGDTKAEWKGLEVYLDENEKEFHHALYADVENDNGATSSGSTKSHAPARTGVPMTPQSSSQNGAKPSGDAATVRSTLAQRYRVTPPAKTT